MFCKDTKVYLIAKKSCTFASIIYRTCFMAVFSLTDAYVHDVAASSATVGMFDGVHEGHRHLVRQLIGIAASAGERPVVVTFDRHPREVLGQTNGGFGLLCDTGERLRRLQQLGDIDIAVLPFSREMASLSACRFLSQLLVPRLHVRHLLLGYDNQFGSRAANDFDRLPLVAAQHGVEILHDEPLLVDGLPVSSTRVRHAVAEGDMMLAERLLGVPFVLGGRVVEGRHEGSRISFPTANVATDDDAIMKPAEGVYAVDVSIGGDVKVWHGIANMGQAPTYGIEKSLLEVHIFDFDADIYGARLDVAFRKRLRSIRAFDTPSGLQRQIECDKAEALAFFANVPSC